MSGSDLRRHTGAGTRTSIELLTGSYDAAEVDDRDRAVGPSHPARLFCALVAAAHGDDDQAALRWRPNPPR
jgi:CRISPR-associated protein Csb2